MFDRKRTKREERSYGAMLRELHELESWNTDRKVKERMIPADWRGLDRTVRQQMQDGHAQHQAADEAERQLHPRVSHPDHRRQPSAQQRSQVDNGVTALGRGAHSFTVQQIVTGGAIKTDDGVAGGL